VVNDSADVTSSVRSFYVCGPATGKARLPTVDSLLVGTTRRLVSTERSDRQLGRSATRVKGPRYPGIILQRTLTTFEKQNIMFHTIVISVCMYVRHSQNTSD